jgi:cytochrome P450/glutathione S-transferase
MKLLAFPPSVDTETARWVLGHHGVQFEEVRRSAVGSALTAIRHRAAVPIFVKGRKELSPAGPIADSLDAAAPLERRLMPADENTRREVETLWREFNGRMGVWIAQWIYHTVLSNRELALRLLTDGVPGWQVLLDRTLFPLVALGMRLGLGRLDESVAREALTRCKATFDLVEARLADGRPYLTGDRLTRADVAFAACAAPLLLSEAYGGTLPRLEELPAAMQKEVLFFREHPAGHFALRLYRDHYRTPRADRIPAGFAIPRPSALQSLGDSLKARLAGPRILRFVFALLRRFAPVLRFGNTAIVTRHRDVVDVLKRDGEFSVVATNGARMDALDASFMLGMDPGDRYRRERGWLDRCVHPDDLQRIRELVRERCERLLDQAAERGWIDVGGEYARVVATAVVQDYFGVPGPDTPTLMRWMRSLFYDLFLNLGSDPGVHRTAAEAAEALKEHLLEQIAALRRGSGGSDTVLARLVKLSATDSLLDDHGIRRSISGVIVGAVDTTNKSFCLALNQLLGRPAALRRARAAAKTDDIEEVGRSVFEALRFDPHNPIIVRHCPADVRVGARAGTVIAAGSTVYAATLSAMFDPAIFSSPRSFRTNRGVPYLHFGGGMHRCFGAAINEVTLPELAAALLRRSPLRRAGLLRGRIHYDGPFPDRLEVRFLTPASVE